MAAVLHTPSSAARAAGVPESFIRYLEQRGVITPLRTENGRRILTEAHVEQVKAYRAARSASKDAA